MAQQSPDAIPEFLGPDLPPHTESGWALFWELHDTRGASQVGLLPITYTEMVSYQTLSRRRITPLDAALVREADKALRNEIAERAALRASASNEAA